MDENRLTIHYGDHNFVELTEGDTGVQKQARTHWAGTITFLAHDDIHNNQHFLDAMRKSVQSGLDGRIMGSGIMLQLTGLSITRRIAWDKSLQERYAGTEEIRAVITVNYKSLYTSEIQDVE